MQRCYTLNVVVVFSMLFLFSCGDDVPREVRQALKQAKSNRSELEKVVSHYQQLGDSLKLRAAYFLIANMADKYSTVHPATASAYSFLHANISKYERRRGNYDVHKTKVDSIKATNPSSLDIFPDITTIKAGFLIENIDLAFEAWKNPWSKQLSFEQFCENILPYRMQHEPLSSWRKVLHDEYVGSIDTLQGIADIHKVAMALNSAIANRFYLYEDYQLASPSVISLNEKGVGGCNEKYQLAVAVFRTFGIPSAIDFSPQLTYDFKGHEWVVYWDSTGSINPIDAGDARRPKNNKHKKYLPIKDGKATSVYRHTYTVQKQSLQYLKRRMVKPQVFEEASMANVTHEYDFPQQIVTFDLNSKQSKQKVLYLSTFTYRQQLSAVSWAMPQKKQVQFSNVGNSGVYILTLYDRDSLHAVSNPVLVRDSGKVETLLPQAGKTQDVVLTRKCKISLQMQEFARGMVGTVFEGSNTPDFKNSTVLYTITEMPEFLVEQAVSSSEKYRYVRYRSPQAELRIAEVQFFEKDENGVEHKLSGNAISSVAPKDDNPESNPENALDGDIRTNFNAPQGSWIGLDLERAVQLSKVAYLPRNSWNVIEPGNRYELLYYDNGWHSLGVKRATEQYLKYSNVPIGALLVLKNLTQGKEERIFTYENGKQVWW